MNVAEFKKYLRQFRDEESVLDVIAAYIGCTCSEDCTYILQQATDRLYYIASLATHKSKILRTQLDMTQMYLKGELYKDSEVAKQMLPLQIANIERVLYSDE